MYAMYVGMYECIVCMYAWNVWHVCMQGMQCMYVCMHVCMHVCIYVCIYLMHVCNVCTYVCKIFMYVCM